MNNKAFTLIELIIAIAIIAILAALSFTAVDPGRRIGNANDDKRLTEANSIEEAINKYTADNLILPPSIASITDTFPYMITNTNIVGNINCGAVLNIGKINIGTELEDYLPTIPIDPSITDETTEGTGYYLVKNGQNIQVSSCLKYSYSLANLVCGGTILDERDNKEYATILIGGQCWMRQGLNIGTRIDSGTSQSTTEMEKYCYDNDDNNCDTITSSNTYPDGGLYQWDGAMQGATTEGAQGICMAGWHIPSDDEFKTLEMELGMSYGEANSSGFRGSIELKVGSVSGFEGNLSGYYESNSWINKGVYGPFWSSSMGGSNLWFRLLFFQNNQVLRGEQDKEHPYSIRCLKD